MKPRTATGSAIRRAYREGRQAPPGTLNPYFDGSLREHWSRGHRDRWLFGMDADGTHKARGLLAAKLLIAIGASAIIYSFINALGA
jgi:hypothetical protein